MNKLILLASVSIAVSASVAQATEAVDASELSTHRIKNTSSPAKLDAKTAMDFANFSYSANKKAWGDKDQQLFDKLLNDGWKLAPISGTTGFSKQVESASAVLGFKDDQVVIATRGTEMLNGSDWGTNIWNKKTSKQGLSNLFHHVGGNVATGFLTTHESSWDEINAAIAAYAASIGKKPSDLQYTILGHSLGGAKALLNGVKTLTDADLNIGEQVTLEKSFVEPNTDLGMSGFYGIGKKEIKNAGNVEVILLEAPRVGDKDAAKDIENIVGKENILRIENGWDIVPHVSPGFLRFKHAGTQLKINAKGWNTHGMGTIGDEAIKAIEAHRAKVSAQKTAEDAKRELTLSSEASNKPGSDASIAKTGAGSSVSSSYFKRASTMLKNIGNKIVQGATSFVSNTIARFWS